MEYMLKIKKNRYKVMLKSSLENTMMHTNLLNTTAANADVNNTNI